MCSIVWSQEVWFLRFHCFSRVINSLEVFCVSTQIVKLFALVQWKSPLVFFMGIPQLNPRISMVNECTNRLHWVVYLLMVTILILLIQEHGILLHLLVLSLISFNMVLEFYVPGPCFLWRNIFLNIWVSSLDREWDTFP